MRRSGCRHVVYNIVLPARDAHAFRLYPVQRERRYESVLATVYKGNIIKKLNNGLPILHKVPPKRDYGRYFCIMAEKGGTFHGGLTEKLSPFFHAKKQEVSSIFPTLGSGLANALSGTSYASEDTDLLGVDEDYTALENELAQTVANIESTHPGYDEYRYSVDEIGHNPYELAS